MELNEKNEKMASFHMVLGLGRVCGVLDRTVYGASRHLGSSPHSAIQSLGGSQCVAFTFLGLSALVSRLNG